MMMVLRLSIIGGMANGGFWCPVCECGMTEMFKEEFHECGG